MNKQLPTNNDKWSTMSDEAASEVIAEIKAAAIPQKSADWRNDIIYEFPKARGVYILKYRRTKGGALTFHHNLLVTDRSHPDDTKPLVAKDGHTIKQHEDLNGILYDWGSEMQRGQKAPRVFSWSSAWDKDGQIKFIKRYNKHESERQLQESGMDGKVQYDYRGDTNWSNGQIQTYLRLCGPKGSYNLFFNNCQTVTGVVADALISYPNGLTVEQMKAVRAAKNSKK